MNTESIFVEARLRQLEQDNASIKADNTRLYTRFEKAESRYLHAQRRLRVQSGLALAVVAAAIFLSPANRAAMAQGYGTTLAQLLKDVTDLQNKTKYLSVSGTDTYLTGTNLHILNGTGSTQTTNSLGNLIVGYNELGNTLYGDTRSGSHNIIVGQQNSYSSYGGLVAGASNLIANNFATVTGGVYNESAGSYSSVMGGFQNTASGKYSSVSGGALNQATYISTAVSGGVQNTANNQYASVSGGGGNIASGFASSVSGGNQSTAKGQNSSVSGGNTNYAEGNLSSISGGHNNHATGDTASISGGDGLTQSAQIGWSGGSYHTP